MRIIWENFFQSYALQDFKRFLENDAVFDKLLEDKVYIIVNKNSQPETRQLLQLLKRIEALEGQIADLQQKSKQPADNLCRDRTDQIEKRLEVLEGIVAKQDELIRRYDEQNRKLYGEVQKQEELIRRQGQKIQDLEGIIASWQTVSSVQSEAADAKDRAAQPPISPVQPATSRQSSDTSSTPSFYIENGGKLLLSGQAETIIRELQPALHLEPILEYLEEADFEQKAIYSKMFRRLKGDMEKFINKLDIDDDDDELFENVTKAFFKIIKKDLLAVLMVSIHRGMNIEKDKPFYEELLGLINAYLQSCCIYTEKIEEGIIYTDTILEKMDPLRKQTSDLAKDKEIEEIERLPYCIDFLNEDGERESIWYEGQCVILKYEE